MSEEKEIIKRVVENYALTGQAVDARVLVTLLPDNKTSVVEATPDGGRGLSLDEFRTDGRVIWAAYSSRSRTVFLSEMRRR